MLCPDPALDLPTPDAIRQAARRLSGQAHRTPVLTCAGLDAQTGARLFFKCENLQKAGAFKFRGAYAAVSALTEREAARGVVTHSSGNHAAALALAARCRGIPAHIVMPHNASAAKRAAVLAYGGQLVPCAPTLASRQETARQVQETTGAVLIHPYDNPLVIAGQGTVALELLEQVPDLDAIIVPVSGGGLISGIALAAADVRPETAIYGAEPAQADDARRSLQSGQLESPGAADTVADGLRAALCARTFSVIRRRVRTIVTMEEADIIAAMRLIWERLKLVAEASAAVALAAVLTAPEAFTGRKVGIILSGGNVDLDHLPW